MQLMPSVWRRPRRRQLCGMLNLASGFVPKPGPVEGGSFMKVYLISATEETMLHNGSERPWLLTTTRANPVHTRGKT